MKFEYLVCGHDFLLVTGKELQEWLNEMGQDEWEVSACLPEYSMIIFKRRIEINEKLRAAQLKEVPNNDDKNGSSEVAGGIQEEGL